jgi:hypothetical protein
MRKYSTDVAMRSWKDPGDVWDGKKGEFAGVADMVFVLLTVLVLSRSLPFL